METYKKEFIHLLLEKNALKFGEFVLKSRRKSPYFINTGGFDDGDSIKKLGSFYASAINKVIGDGFDVLFGPAYKGISLAVAASVALSNDFGINVKYSFDRKEIKDYGDKGFLVGHKINDQEKILIIDDVITSGISIRNSVKAVSSVAKVDFVGVVISVDRQEKGKEKSALKELEEEIGMRIYSIVTVREIIGYLHNKEINGKVYIDDGMKEKMEAYLREYGAG